MPKTTKHGSPNESELPATLQRSSPKAQRTFAKSHDAAVKEYGEGERAHRVAYAALKQTFEKVGDHWESKPHRGNSEPAGRSRSDATHGGVDTSATKEHLLALARKLGIRGRSTMRKQELIEALENASKSGSKARS